MTFEINNMLEVANLISALEMRIEFELSNSDKVGNEATMSLYNQVKKVYNKYLHFKY